MFFFLFGPLFIDLSLSNQENVIFLYLNLVALMLF